MVKRGFSLLEIMIALALVATIGASISMHMSSTLDMKDEVADISKRTHLIRQAMRRVSEEISMAYIDSHINGPELRYKSGLIGTRDTLDFTAFGHVSRRAESKESEQRELGFKLDYDDRSSTDSLKRREAPNPDDELEDGGRWRTLLTGVRRIAFEYWDEQNREWIERWDTDDSRFRGRLPSRIKFEVEVEMPFGETERFVTQSRIWLTRPIDLRI